MAARSRGFDADLCCSLVAKSARGYREAIREFAAMRNLDLWYVRLDADAMTRRWAGEIGPKMLGNFTSQVAKAKSKDHLKAVSKLTEEVDGRLRFRADPPLLTPADQVFDPLLEGA